MEYDRFEDPRHIAWAKAVKARDEYMCQICGATQVYLHSHHCNSWDFFVDERFDVDNGSTLCVYHHELFHRIYGRGKNTRYQFEEYISFLNIIENILLDETLNGS